MKVSFFTGIILSRKLKYKKVFVIACSFIVNKLRATDSSISPALINEVDSINTSVPWLGSLLWIFLLEHSSTDSEQYSTWWDWPFLSRLELNQQKQSNTGFATSKNKSTWKKDQSLYGLLTCPHARHMPYSMSQLRYQFIGRDMPLQKLSGMAILVSLQECGFSRI